MAYININVAVATNASGIINQSVERRSADYKANIWNYDHLQSLGNQFDEEKYRIQTQKLVEEVKQLFVETVDPLVRLQLSENIKKLGLATYFKKEIDRVLDIIESLKRMSSNLSIEEDLYATSLCFRMLRIHGRNVSQDMFMGFPYKGDKSMNLKVKAMLGLYEASHLAMEGENILEQAQIFATDFLKSVHPQLDDQLSKEVAQALELPFNLRVEWFNVRNHIHDYEKERNSNIALLKLAKLNFNVVQAIHQRDLKDLLRWWNKLGIMKNLSFTRNRVVESYLWTVGVASKPDYGNLRKRLTKVTNLVLFIDDVYDVFGTLDELETFTSAIERWDTEGNELLPQPMKYCMEILYDTVDYIANEILKEKGWMVQQHIQNAWIDFCKGLLVEARWYHNGYTPKLHEYLDNGWVTSCGPLLSLHVLFTVMHGPQQEAIDFLKNNHDLVCNTSMIIRLCNDQGTSKAEQQRGDAPTAIMCYMKEANATEEVAVKHIKNIITNTWTKINNHSMFQSPSIKYITNLARVTHFIYQNGDGFGVQDRETRDEVLALLVDPFHLD